MGSAEIVVGFLLLQNICLYLSSAVLQCVVPTEVMTAALQNASFWLGSGVLTALPCFEQSSSPSSPACPAAQLPSHSSLCATPFGGCPPSLMLHVAFLGKISSPTPFLVLFPLLWSADASCCKHYRVLCTEHASGKGFSLQHNGDEPLLLLLLCPLYALVFPNRCISCWGPITLPSRLRSLCRPRSLALNASVALGRSRGEFCTTSVPSSLQLHAPSPS